MVPLLSFESLYRETNRFVGLRIVDTVVGAGIFVIGFVEVVLVEENASAGEIVEPTIPVTANTAMTSDFDIDVERGPCILNSVLSRDLCKDVDANVS